MPTITLTADNDDVAIEDSESIVNALAGDDLITDFGAFNTINGDAGNDVITSFGLYSILNGGEGDDTIAAYQTTTMNGDSGDDNLTLEASDSLVDGGEGNDTLRSSGSGNTVKSGGGDDWLFVTGATGTTTVEAGLGNDQLFVAGMFMTVMAGAGDDVIYNGPEFSGITPFVDFCTVDAGDGNDTVTGVYRFGILRGGAGDDSIDVVSGAQEISGGEGNDRIKVGPASAKVKVTGDAGDDTLVLEQPEVTTDITQYVSLAGGVGNDIYEIDTMQFTLIENSGEGIDTLRSSVISLDLGQVVNVENAVLQGTAALNLIGNDGKNWLGGNDAANALQGLSGNDTLSGSGGRDVMTGGTGKDVFDFNVMSDTAFGADRDVITDYTRLVDKIDLADIDASTKFAGNQAFKFIGGQGYHKIAGELRFWTNDQAGTANDFTVIGADLNGDGHGDMQIQLKGLFALTAGDFVL